jgi:hypothetical protein
MNDSMPKEITPTRFTYSSKVWQSSGIIHILVNDDTTKEEKVYKVCDDGVIFGKRDTHILKRYRNH